MKRRNFIGTLAAAITAAGSGIVITTKKEGHLEHFARFFKKRNGFEMNGFQIAAYVLYEKGKRFYFPPEQGMTTFFQTLASYESNKRNKNVLFVGQDFLIEYDKDGSIQGCINYDKEVYLCGKRYDIIISDIKDDRDFTRGVYRLSYYAETVVAQCGVLKKRYPNYNV